MVLFNTLKMIIPTPVRRKWNDHTLSGAFFTGVTLSKKAYNYLSKTRGKK